MSLVHETDSINPRRRPIIPARDCLALCPLLQLACQLPGVSALAVGALFGLAPAALGGAYVLVRAARQHHTPGALPCAGATAPSSVFLWLLKLVPSQYPPTMLMTMSTPVTICTRRLPSYA